ncbi:hypothetical protein AMTRI_Chr12g271440 [Amborella trichopoda]
MSAWFRKLEHFSQSPFDCYSPSSSLSLSQNLLCKSKPCFSPFFAEEEMGLSLDLFNPFPSSSLSIEFLNPSMYSGFESVTDLLEIRRSIFDGVSVRRFQRIDYLQSLSDRISALELGFGELCNADRKYEWTAEIKGRGSPRHEEIDRKYKLTAEIKGNGKPRQETDRKYKWTAEIKGARKEAGGPHGKEKAGHDRKYKWMAEIKGGSGSADASHIYTFKSTTKPLEKSGAKHEKRVEKCGGARVVAVEDGGSHQNAIALREKILARRREAAAAKAKAKGKRKELSAVEAAVIIQSSFRAHLVRRSRSLHSLRALAVAKAKLKEIRSLFLNFSYRRRLASDPEERQRFSEKIIVLLLTVDAIEGWDPMVREARRSMVEELEAMLDVVDPQPQALGKLRRRKFDLPACGPIQKEMALGIAEVVEMLDSDPAAVHDITL